MSENQSFRQVPFFRLLIPFVLGITGGLVTPSFIKPEIHTALLLLVLALYLASLFFQVKWHYRWITGILVYLFLLLAGAYIAINQSRGSKILENAEQEAIVCLAEPPEMRNLSRRALGVVESVIAEGEWNTVDEKVMLYFRTSDTLADKLKKGSRIAVKTAFSSPPEAQNPYQFNYKKYLSGKKIHRVAFVPEGNWVEISSKENGFLSFPIILRNKLLSIFSKGGIEGQNLAVVSALTMGYTSLLDDEIRQVYSATGAMHILSVSGLHVGIIFFIASALLFFLDRIKNGKKIKALILVLFLWLYAIFTGLSPSVLRASLMFSLVIIGIAVNRKTSIYNTLSASAFILIGINPRLITDIGFQLSYIAVASIVFFYPYIYNALYVSNKWVDKVWSLTAVSVAAQLGTFALGLYYFQQFPNYFLLANLFAIPLSTIVIYLAILIIIVSPIPFITGIIGWLLDKSLSLLNYLLSLTESLPYSTSTGIGISQSQTIALLLAVILLAIFLERKKFIVLVGTLACLLLFFVEMTFTRIQQLNQTELVVFNVKGSSAVGFTEGRKITFVVADSADLNPDIKYSFNLKGYISNMGVKVNSDVINLKESRKEINTSPMLNGFTNVHGGWFNFKGKTVFIPLGEQLDQYTSNSKLDVDILVITKNLKSKIDPVLDIISPGIVVVDASVPVWKAEKIKKILELKGLKHHFVANKGAFVEKI